MSDYRDLARTHTALAAGYLQLSGQKEATKLVDLALKIQRGDEDFSPVTPESVRAGLRSVGSDPDASPALVKEARRLAAALR